MSDGAIPKSTVLIIIAFLLLSICLALKVNTEKAVKSCIIDDAISGAYTNLPHRVEFYFFKWDVRAHMMKHFHSRGTSPKHGERSRRSGSMKERMNFKNSCHKVLISVNKLISEIGS